MTIKCICKLTLKGVTTEVVAVKIFQYTPMIQENDTKEGYFNIIDEHRDIQICTQRQKMKEPSMLG